MEEIEYRKNGETYKIQKREPIDEVRHVPLWLLIPMVLFMVLGGYLIFASIGTESTGQTEYKVEGDIDYQVYLKENDYYTEKFLESGRQYIAGLISAVRADFNYQLAADENTNAHYEYEIIATAKATEKGDKSKILYEKAETLKRGEVKEITQGTFRIHDNVSIDYAKYNEYLKNFRSEFGISADCLLDLKMIVKVDGAIKTEDVLAMNIPLSTQTVDIMIDADAINREEKVGEANQEIYIKNIQLLVVGAVMLVASIAASGIIIYLHKTRFGNNWYAEALYKIFKNYDTRIVNVSENFYEPENTMRVSEFIELVDAANTENAPILYCEVVPEYKAYFVVAGANAIYRYTLTRAYQDELRRTGQKKEF
jgi:hypothetical protein